MPIEFNLQYTRNREAFHGDREHPYRHMLDVLDDIRGQLDYVYPLHIEEAPREDRPSLRAEYRAETARLRPRIAEYEAALPGLAALPSLTNAQRWDRIIRSDFGIALPHPERMRRLYEHYGRFLVPVVVQFKEAA